MRLHVLGGGRWQLPTIRLAKRMGWEVFVTDSNQTCLGYGAADGHAVADLKDKELTLEIARRWEADAIVCDTTDVGVPTMAWVAEALGLRGIGYEAALNFTDKHRMRELTEAAGLASPRYALAASAAEAAVAAQSIGACVVKPRTAQSSRGVTFARTPAEAAAAYEAAAEFGASVLVEEFIEGVEATVEGYCVDGAPVAAAMSQKAHIPGTGIAHTLMYPLDLPDAVQRKVVDVNRAVVRALGLRNGVTHGEYLIRGDEVYLVEVAARGGGSYVYTDILPLVSGLPVPERYLRYLAGEPFGLLTDTRALPPQRAVNLAFFLFPPGRVQEMPDLSAFLACDWVEQLLIEFRVGEDVRSVDDDRSRHGLMVVTADSLDELRVRTAQLYEEVRVKIDGAWRSGEPTAHAREKGGADAR